LIYAGVATIPGREEALVDLIRSLEHQVDWIIVAANDHPEPKHPAMEELYACEIEWHFPDERDWRFRDDRWTGKGDAAKFIGVEMMRPDDVFLATDDDLILRSDYVEKMIAGLDRLNAPISCHGRSFDTWPVQSYYHGATRRFYGLGEEKEDKQVQVPGSGSFAFRFGMCRITPEHFGLPNMADLWLGKLLAEQRVPVYGMAHDLGFITLNRKVDLKDTIWEKHHLHDSKQTRILNETKWPALD